MIVHTLVFLASTANCFSLKVLCLGCFVRFTRFNQSSDEGAAGVALYCVLYVQLVSLFKVLISVSEYFKQHFGFF